MQILPLLQIRHRMNRISHSIGHALYEFPNHPSAKVVLSFPGVTSSMHEFQMLKNHVNPRTLYQCSLLLGWICLVLLA